MRYIAIDLETTGLNAPPCQVLEMAAIIEDTNNRCEIKNLPRFHVYVWHDLWVWEPEALRLNWELAKEILEVEKKLRIGKEGRTAISDVEPVLKKHKLDRNQLEELINFKSPIPLLRAFEVTEYFKRFLAENEFSMDRGFVAAGKNFASFDLNFLNQMMYWKEQIRIKHRTLDPAILFFQPKSDGEPPSLYECAKRLMGVPVPETHRAVDDAELVITLLRHGLHYFRNGEEQLRNIIDVSN